MHDDMIVSYNVNFQNRSVVLYTYNDSQQRKGQIEFFDVLTHLFEGILEYNQILDIESREIENFIKENNELLKNMKGYCWPIVYQNIQELEKFLVKERYRYIKIFSTYGMSGWILAKSFQIKHQN